MIEIKLNLKKYQRPNLRFCKTPVISIHPGGLRFNRASFEYLAGKKFCDLYCDEVQKIVVIKPIVAESLDSVKINASGLKKGNVTISCKPFIDQFKISVCLGFFRANVEKKSVPVQATWDVKEKWFVLDLKPHSKY